MERKEENERKLKRFLEQEADAKVEIWKAIDALCDARLAITLQKKIMRKDNEHSSSN